MSLRERILETLRADKGRPMRRGEILSSCGVPRPQRPAARKTLLEMVRNGDLVRLKGSFYALPRQLQLVTGVLKSHPHGFGFVCPTDAALEDMYVHRENMGTALDGDTVLVRTLPPHPYKQTKGPEGEIVEVVKRRSSQIVGTLRKSPHFHYVLPDNPAIYQDILIPSKKLGKANVDDKVIAKITAWESKHLSPEGAIVKVLGPSGNIKTDIAAIIVRYNLPKSFPKAVLAEIRAASETIGRKEIAGRRDLRAEQIFTIDPKTAKDFDDAVNLSRGHDGTWTIGVHIADVAHYVPEGGALDAEAARRGTSAYLLSTVVPMLPTKLSNGLCSLKPHVDRLTRSVIMTFSADGILRRYDICRSVINSKRRFTYQEVQAVLDGERGSRFAATLKDMAALAAVLRRRRRERGCVDFDVPEPKPVVGPDGDIASFEIEQRDEAHGLIEEFMIAANETVARHLIQKKHPTIFRVHEDPDENRLAEFADVARRFGHDIPTHPSPRDIQSALDKAHGTPGAYPIGVAYLRSMKLAKYAAENLGHYGLASDAYLHFTSPIRRYPDLVVHRGLDAHKPRSKAALAALYETLKSTAAKSSETERNADEAENELRKVATLRYLDTLAQKRRAPVLDGIVRDIKSFGMQVTLVDYLIEGTVRIRSLVNDSYRFDKTTRRLVGRHRSSAYKIGMSLKVRLKRVDLFSREIELVPVTK